MGLYECIAGIAHPAYTLGQSSIGYIVTQDALTSGGYEVES